jgi:hypothetical protein
MHRKRKEVAHQNATSSFLFIFEKRFIERKYIAGIYMAVGHKFRYIFIIINIIIHIYIYIGYGW